jgi:hypothetical protein
MFMEEIAVGEESKEQPQAADGATGEATPK